MMNSCSGYPPNTHYQIIFMERNCPLCVALKDCADAEAETMRLRAQGLALHSIVSDDGTWLVFAAPNSPTAMIRLESLAENYVGIIHLAIDAFVRFVRSKVQ